MEFRESLGRPDSAVRRWISISPGRDLSGPTVPFVRRMSYRGISRRHVFLSAAVRVKIVITVIAVCQSAPIEYSLIK